MTKEDDFWNLSENLKATAAVLSRLSTRALCYAADYTKAHEVLRLVEGLLANVKVLIEAAQAAQYISHSSTKEVLKVSVALRKYMWQYESDLRTCLDGGEDDIGINRPSTIYERVIGGIHRVEEKYGSILNDLRNEIDAESLMQTEDEKPTEIVLNKSEFGKRRGRFMKLLEDLEGKRPKEPVKLSLPRHGKDAVKTLRDALRNVYPEVVDKIHKKGSTAYSDIVIKLQA